MLSTWKTIQEILSRHWTCFTIVLSHCAHAAVIYAGRSKDTHINNCIWSAILLMSLAWDLGQKCALFQYVLHLLCSTCVLKLFAVRSLQNIQYIVEDMCTSEIPLENCLPLLCLFREAYLIDLYRLMPEDLKLHGQHMTSNLISLLCSHATCLNFTPMSCACKIAAARDWVHTPLK